ncbi:hypothetical protein MNBD_ALPHA11-1562 [hydrothermal vent metagenome]|uniref:Uncharacterized protein n=1 Tax=hydrothermal vent metagenome TaxID=652676 RepID=A0A3B0UGY2_9ZZZZ
MPAKKNYLNQGARKYVRDNLVENYELKEQK